MGKKNDIPSNPKYNYTQNKLCLKNRGQEGENGLATDLSKQGILKTINGFNIQKLPTEL